MEVTFDVSYMEERTLNMISGTAKSVELDHKERHHYAKAIAKELQEMGHTRHDVSEVFSRPRVAASVSTGLRP
eukprot:12209084-Karenia_brevis.AAC.1